jgi:hypothetical protein
MLNNYRISFKISNEENKIRQKKTIQGIYWI